MKLQLSRLQIISAAFVILSISSALYVSAAALNYLRFYPALSGIETHVTKFVALNSLSTTSFSGEVAIDNPSDYQGFSVRDIILRVYLVHPNDSSNVTLFNPGIIGSQIVNRPLGPHQTIVANVSIKLDSDQTRSFLEFHQMYSGHILAHALLTVDILTFLEPVTGRTSLDTVEDVPLS